MRTHIKVVAIVNIVLGALGVLGCLLGLVGGTLGSLFSGSLVGALVGTIGVVVATIIGGALAVLQLLAGFGLQSGKSWARFTIILVSAIGLFNFPFGTLFGIYSLWVLMSAEGQREFASGTV